MLDGADRAVKLMLGEDEPSAALLSAPMSAVSSGRSSPLLPPSPAQPIASPSLGVTTPVRQTAPPARGMPGVVSQAPIRTPSSSGRAMPGSARRAASTPARPIAPPGFGPGTYSLADF